MQLARVTYNSAEIKTSVFLLLYLRMNGIYVYERFFDVGTSAGNRLLGRVFGATDEEQPIRSYDQFEMELFLLSSEYDCLEFGRYKPVERMIVIASEELKKQYDYLEKDYDIVWSTGPSEELLDELIERMFKNDIISQQDEKVLGKTATIYCEDKLTRLSFKAKYFYVAEDKKKFHIIEGEYENIYQHLLDQLRNMTAKWGDKDSLNLQYALLNIAYEADLYCYRNKEPLLYTPDSIIRICDMILEKKENEMLLGESFYLLKAQVYDDLLQETEKAFSDYLRACTDYNCYAYYKKGMYAMNRKGDYSKAIDYLKKSVLIYPSYYRAWHMMGICFDKLGQWENAICAFENVEIILTSRMEEKRLRPMEIEYLFKAASQCGDIRSGKLFHMPEARKEYEMAEKVWDAINQTEFFDMISLPSEEQSAYKRRIKKELNIRRVYSKLTELYAEVGDREKQIEYIRKITG